MANSVQSPDSYTLIGQRFGRLVVVRDELVKSVLSGQHCREIDALCDCGKTVKIVTQSARRAMQRGRRVSCGCAKADPTIRRAARLKVDPVERQKIASLGGVVRSQMPDVPAQMKAARKAGVLEAERKKGAELIRKHLHMARKDFELTFWGGSSIRYRRFHATLEAAQETARRVLAKLDNRAAHPAIIYGPGLGADGLTIS